MTMNSSKLTGSTAHIGLKLDRGLHQKIRQLAASTGVSVNFAIRRALIEMVNAGRIPMPGAMREEELAEVATQPVRDPRDERLAELEGYFQKAQEKIAELRGGTLTPVFDGHGPNDPKQRKGRQKAQPSPVQSGED